MRHPLRASPPIPAVGSWCERTERGYACFAGPIRVGSGEMVDGYDEMLPGYERFFASGKERTRLELSPGYGYRWQGMESQPYTLAPR